MTAIDKIVNEIAEAEAVWHKEPIAQLPKQRLKEWADGIRSEYDTLRREALKVIDEIASDKTCMHCDMHEACTHGVDGMPTACNEFLKARAFREKYRVEETRSDDCPF